MVATTAPLAFVARSAEGSPVIAKRVVVAFVVVELPTMVRFPLMVELAAMRPPLKVMSEVVALLGNGSWSVAPVASVPQERTPAALAFTSQLALLRLETMRFEVDALPVMTKLVNVEVAVDVAVNEPARAFVPKSELPTTESVRHGDVVPSPTLPEKNDVVVFGSNQYSADVVAFEPMVTTSEALLG